MTDITTVLKPHVQAIMASAESGDARAKEVISLHRMHVSCPQDPAAPALCEAAFGEWLKDQSE